MYIRRHIESQILKVEAGFKSCLVTGARQTGKSTTLKHLHGDRTYISFDDPVILEETRREPGLFFRNNTPPIILDEVQKISELFPYIKILCDNLSDNGFIDLTGSQQYQLMKNISESLAGRIGILEMQPLSLRELRDDDFNKPFIPDESYITERKRSYTPENNVWKRIFMGGYPELAVSGKDWQLFYSSYVQTYLNRDLNEMLNVKDKLKFSRFLTVLASTTGQMLNYSNIADKVEISVATVKEWISVLEAGGLVFILQPFSNSALTRAIKTPKLYFKDTGLVCYLTRYQTPESAMNGAISGQLFETYIVSEIMKSFSNAGLDYRFYLSYYRGKDKIRRKEGSEIQPKESEIDLLIESGDTIYPVEIKMSANPKLSMSNAFDVIDRIPGKKRGIGTIVCMYQKCMWLSENVIVLPFEYI